MRMKLNKPSQLALVALASLLVATMLTACETLTVDFVFVTSSQAAGTNNYGEVDVFEINSESGRMRQIPTSPFPSGGRKPVAEALSSDNTNLFVVNEDDNTIVQFIIGNDGKVYPQNTTNTPGIFPMAVAVSGTNLFVVDTYQPLPTCSPVEPCSGAIGVFPISTATTGTPPSEYLGPVVANGNLSYWPLNLPGKPNDVLVPTAINVLKSGSFLYVTTYDASITPTVGYVFGFAISSGSLSPLNGGMPFVAGTHPSGIASDASSTYVYVTDSANSNVLGYSVSASGMISPLAGSPYQSGGAPSSVAVDPTYPYVYVANGQDSSVSEYSMSNGVLTNIGTMATGLQPVAIGIDPSTNHFLYTVNFLGSSVNGNISGFELDTTNGTLQVSQSSPYKSNALPTAVVAIPHNGTGGGIAK
jgi:6-phosphogluconolactonase (cycloisomerase 2 family)